MAQTRDWDLLKLVRSCHWPVKGSTSVISEKRSSERMAQSVSDSDPYVAFCGKGNGSRVEKKCIIVYVVLLFVDDVRFRRWLF